MRWSGFWQNELIVHKSKPFVTNEGENQRPIRNRSGSSHVVIFTTAFGARKENLGNDIASAKKASGHESISFLWMLSQRVLVEPQESAHFLLPICEVRKTYDKIYRLLIYVYLRV